MRRRWLDLVLGLYLGVVAFGVFGPSPGDAIDEVGAGARQLSADVRTAVPGGEAASARAPSPSDGLVAGLSAEDVGNIAMFVPFGLLFPSRWPRRRWWTVPAGVALSAGIELIQLAFLSWRSPSLIDVRWNSLGAVLGFALWLGARFALARRRRPVGVGPQAAAG